MTPVEAGLAMTFGSSLVVVIQVIAVLAVEFSPAVLFFLIVVAWLGAMAYASIFDP